MVAQGLQKGAIENVSFVVLSPTSFTILRHRTSLSACNQTTTGRLRTFGQLGYGLLSIVQTYETM